MKRLYSAWRRLLSILRCWGKHPPMAFRFNAHVNDDGAWTYDEIRFCVRCGRVLAGGRGWVKPTRMPR